MCEIAAKIRKKYVIGQYSYYSLAYSNLIYFTISWSTKLNYIILRTEPSNSFFAQPVIPIPFAAYFAR